MLKAQRLIRLIMIINAKKSFTVQELADEFGLSYRTITRDLLELSELGVPIYSVQGRGGGYKLLQDRILPPIAFTESEAVALFFACQSLQYFGSLPFDEGASSALHKFYHYLPADVKEQIDRLQNKVAIWSPHRRMSPDCLRTLLKAIMIRKVVTIEYSSRSGTTERNIQPIGLYSSDGYWYCPAYCILRSEQRLFRADRILSATLNDAIPWSDDVEQWNLQNTPEKSRSEQTSLTIELTPNGVWALEADIWFGTAIERREDGSGTATILVPAENLKFYVDLIWKLGGDARILYPAQAIAYTKQKLKAMNSQYL
ncbi:helix-turn-helix transcriptional regulator [Paenibacillus sepulcri]|uniref:YafY family transcriptional regulator n=1 Tax=Paenibacillus sepulcri TaxID=359917 RepID=A0ABS7C965_9BACL|nr:YafY family transcriptional regulator [Paenibacillus sepulcri]